MNDENLIRVQKGQTGKSHPASKPKAKHKKQIVTIRVTAQEYAEIQDKAKDAGLSVSKYGRQCLGLE